MTNWPVVTALPDFGPWFDVTDCTCFGIGCCDQLGDPGCRYCQLLDIEWPCPAEADQ